MVYASATLSLAALEYFVHLDPGMAPALIAVAAEIPFEIPIRDIEPDALPADWRTYPAPESLKDLGTAWVRSGESAALTVPSCVIPWERNVLLNPAHPDFGRILLGTAAPFAFDPRMWK